MDQKAPLQLLILEDRPEDAELMVHELRRSGFDPRLEASRYRVRFPETSQPAAGRNPG